MANNPLFSPYRAGENRVTSSIMAVFQRLELSLLEALLSSVTGESSLELVSFRNQPAGSSTVPDARMSAHFDLWFETKTGRGQLSEKQLRGHLESLDAASRLMVVTPDGECPSVIDALCDDRVTWFSFAQLAGAIEAVLANETSFVGEHARFLLRELVAMFEEDGLLASDDTVVVAARYAYPEYQATAAYVCQAERSFRPGLTHLAFYAEGAIQPLVPRILYQDAASVVFSRDEVEGRLALGGSEAVVAKVIEASLDAGTRPEGEQFRVFLLSAPDAAETIRLVSPVVNDVKAASGRTWGWTLSQRYTRLAHLQSGVTLTSQLDELAGTN